MDPLYKNKQTFDLGSIGILGLIASDQMTMRVLGFVPTPACALQSRRSEALASMHREVEPSSVTCWYCRHCRSDRDYGSHVSVRSSTEILSERQKTQNCSTFGLEYRCERSQRDDNDRSTPESGFVSVRVAYFHCLKMLNLVRSPKLIRFIAD